MSTLIEEIYSQIHYYNTKRIHTILKMPPIIYEQLFIEHSLHKCGTWQSFLMTHSDNLRDRVEVIMRTDIQLNK